ncbi:uncharacterized protein EKO05_0009973 [Ascochyta rabiei]|uniref:Uncharacterized protein n=1 Tax=Didymella rabiei TaxID=5454 RepID=A0A162YCW6_DIDRA|nr:uncharacterized protein EKO05_0009973 [Ascochyta rabiei]KZM19962.1 hypothetical protein ST47_g8892 [Ascochyta rabiei]UPX19720.1 hypothetical protein EKO05_0009973 [Ascochyta rabiei]
MCTKSTQALKRSVAHHSRTRLILNGLRTYRPSNNPSQSWSQPYINLSKLQTHLHMAPKFLDISKSNSTPPTNPRPSRHNKPVKNYVDLIDKLRDPTAAGPISKWMITGRVEGHPVGVLYPNQYQPKLRPSKNELSPEEYESFFEEDMSGSLSGSMSSYASAGQDQTHEEKSKKLRECEESLEVPHQGLVEEDSCKSQKPIVHQKSVIKRYPYPPQIYTRNRSNEEYMALFATLMNTEGLKDDSKGSQQQLAC